MSKHHVFCSILKQINDGHQYVDDPFVALEFQTCRGLRKEVSARTLVILRSWKGRKMVWDVRSQASTRKGPVGVSFVLGLALSCRTLPERLVIIIIIIIMARLRPEPVFAFP